MNGSNIDIEIKGFDSAVKKTARSIASSLPTLIAALTVVITAALIWTDITVSDIFSLRFVGEATVLMLVFFMMYLSMNENGVRAGKTDSEYVRSREGYTAARNAVRERGISDLPDFCEWYVRDELERARRDLLSRAGVSYEYLENSLIPISEAIISGRAGTMTPCEAKTYDEYKRLSCLKKRAVKRALLMKPIRLTPEMLMYEDGRAASRHPIALSIERAHTLRNIRGLAYIAVSTFMVVSVAVSVAEDPNRASVIYGLVKIASLIFTGVRGYSAGVLLYSVDAVAFHDSRTDLLSHFKEWREKRQIKEGGEQDGKYTVKEICKLCEEP